MTTNWHYINNGVKTGPVSTDQLRALLTSQAVPSDTLVWKDGMTAWLPVSQQSDLADAVPAGPPPVPQRSLTNSEDVDKNKVFAILAYLGILWLVPLLAAKDSPFAKFHLNEGLVLFIGAVAGWIVIFVTQIALVFIPFIGWAMIGLLHVALMLAVLGLAITGIVNAANGVRKPLPVIGGRFTLIK